MCVCVCVCVCVGACILVSVLLVKYFWQVLYHCVHIDNYSTIALICTNLQRSKEVASHRGQKSINLC